MVEDVLFVAVLLFIVGLACIPYSQERAGYCFSAALLLMVAGLLANWFTVS